MRAGQRLRTGQVPALSWRMPLRARCPHWVEQALPRTKHRSLPRWEMTADWVPQQVLRLPSPPLEMVPGSARHVALHLINHSTDRFEPITLCSCAYPPLRRHNSYALDAGGLSLQLAPPWCCLSV